MAKPVIQLEPGQMYHIWTHANGTENLFQTSDNYHYFLKKYAVYINPIADTFAYCLMPNHLHLMVRITGVRGTRKIRIKKREGSNYPPQ